MEFNIIELTATLKAGIAMVNADGKVMEEELKVLNLGMLEFGVSQEQYKQLLELGQAMSTATMFSTLSAMNDSQKKFVCGYLASIMVSDGDIDDTEVKLWKLTSTLAGFPTMSIAEACAYWSNH